MRVILPILLLVILLAACGTSAERGTVILLAADTDVPVRSADMEAARAVVKARLDALGMRDRQVTIDGTRLRVELTGVDDPAQAVATLGRPGLLEFIDAGTTYLPPGTRVTTTYSRPEPEEATGGTISSTQPLPTVLTGNYIEKASVYQDPATGTFGIQFDLNDAGTQILWDFTGAHADNNQEPYYYLAVAVDKEVISCPHIAEVIPNGQGILEGDLTRDEAEQLAILLRTGALPVPLAVESVETEPSK